MHFWKQYLDLCQVSEPLDVVHASQIPGPIVVDAVGGSGTRVVREILQVLGVEMMNGMNEAGDAHAWPPLQQILASSSTRVASREALISHAFVALEKFLLFQLNKNAHEGMCGFKVPHVFIWLQELADFFPEMKYVHVIRHGLDMAYSKNRRQFRGQHWYYGVQMHDMGEPEDTPIKPARLLDYWIAANRGAQRDCSAFLPDRHLWLVYEELLAEPHEQVTRLMKFLGVEASADRTRRAAELVKPNTGVGRYREQPWEEDFTLDQRAAVAALGYAQ